MKNVSFLLFVFLFYPNLGAQEKDSIQIKNIETVTLEGKKKIFERKVDRFIYNVQNTMVSEGSSGIEVLASTPLLKVDEDKGLLSIVGKSGASIMVNDRMLNLAGAELMNYLKSLRSENISKIEVITTPPAKYEAQGNSGIINIVLKRNQNLGFSGYLNSYYKQSTYGGFGGSAGLNYQNKKLKTSVKFRGFDEEKRSVENAAFIGKSSEISRDERRDMNDGLGMNANIDYSLSDMANVGFIYDLSKSHFNMDIDSNSQYFTGIQNTLNTETDSKHSSNSTSQLLNVFYDQKLGDHKLSFGANYYGNTPETKVNFITTNLADQSNQIVRNLSTVGYKIYSTQGDLSLNLKNIKVETGLKYSQFFNQSDIQYFNFMNSDYQISPVRSNLFDYKEKNYAAYASVAKDFGEKWSSKFGLRYEYAQTDGFAATDQSTTENSYGQLFPTAYISYNASENNQFSLNYSRRINRPNFRALNPFRWYSNPNSYHTGNPTLQPSFNHNFEFNYIFKSKLSSNAYYQRGSANFDQISFLNGIDMISTFENYYNDNTYGLNFNYANTFFKLWETTISTSLSYNNSEILKFDAISQNGLYFYYSTNNTFQLNKKRTIFLLMNYWQSLPSKSGNGFSKSNGNFSTGIKMSLLEKALQLNLSVNDVFRQSGYRGSEYFADNIQTYDNYWDARRLTFSVTYNFGNQKVKTNNRSVDFDEKNRAN